MFLIKFPKDLPGDAYELKSNDEKAIQRVMRRNGLPKTAEFAVYDAVTLVRL